MLFNFMGSPQLDMIGHLVMGPHIYIKWNTRLGFHGWVLPPKKRGRVHCSLLVESLKKQGFDYFKNGFSSPRYASYFFPINVVYLYALTSYMGNIFYFQIWTFHMFDVHWSIYFLQLVLEHGHVSFRAAYFLFYFFGFLVQPFERWLLDLFFIFCSVLFVGFL